MTEYLPLEERDIAEIVHLIEQGDIDGAYRLVGDAHVGDIARLIESLPRKLRLGFWQRFDAIRKGEILAEMTSDEVRNHLIQSMDTEAVIAVTEHLDMDDRVDILDALDEGAVAEVLASLDEQNRAILERAIGYAEDTAGGLMNSDVVTVRADVPLHVVSRYLRQRGDLPPATTEIIVIDRDQRYLGVLPVAYLLTKPPELLVSEMIVDRQPVHVDDSARDVSQAFAQHDWIAAPVVDSGDRLVGRVTVDDVLDIVREEAEHSVRGMVGMSEDEDTFAPIMQSALRRSAWLGINLLTAFIAAWVIHFFDRTIEHVVTLAILMPIVASMGGIAGSQTLMLVTRGIALGRVNTRNARWLLNKEVAIGLLNGLLWALVIAASVYWWFDSVPLATIIGLAIVINLLAAALSGVVVPMVLQWLSIDPALAGSVVLTTITDVVGFWALLGIATIWLL